MEGADNNTRRAKAEVRGDEDRTSSGRPGASDGEHEDGAIKKHAPAGRGETQLGKAREKDAAGRENFEWDYGVRSDEVLNGNEGNESAEGGEERPKLDFASETVEEERNSYDLGMIVSICPQ